MTKKAMPERFQTKRGIYTRAARLAQGWKVSPTPPPPMGTVDLYQFIAWADEACGGEGQSGHLSCVSLKYAAALVAKTRRSMRVRYPGASRTEINQRVGWMNANAGPFNTPDVADDEILLPPLRAHTEGR